MIQWYKVLFVRQNWQDIPTRDYMKQLLKNTQVFSYAATMFFFLSVFLYALYLVCILSIAVRNSMDYGRDYYIFVLNKYGRAIFSFSLLAFGLVLILLIGFQLPFQPAFAELLQNIFLPFLFCRPPALFCRFCIFCFPYN